MDKRVCISCLKEKSTSDFSYRNDTGKYREYCKKCKSPRSKEWMLTRTSKPCKICKEDKPIIEYAVGENKSRPYCIKCERERKIAHYEKNKLRVRLKQKEYYEKNGEKVRAKVNEYRKRELESVSKRKGEYYRNNLDKVRAWRNGYEEKNRDRLSAERKAKRPLRLDKVRAYLKKRRETDVHFRLQARLRTRVRMALKRYNKSKSASSEDLLGCSILFFKEYFCSLFTDGMTWDKFMAGDIHVDHIKPCKLFNLAIDKEQKECFHYTNLQPLWKIDNLRKGVSYG